MILTLRPVQERQRHEALLASWAVTVAAPERECRAATVFQTISVSAAPTFAVVPCDTFACRTEYEPTDVFLHCEHRITVSRDPDIPECSSQYLGQMWQWKTWD